MIKNWLLAWTLLTALLVASCSIAPLLGKHDIGSGKIPNGVFEGEYIKFPNSATVRVTIKNGRIDKIDMLHHGASPSHGQPAALKILQRIVDEQSTDVDAVSGATRSSIVIMNAVQNAVDTAKQANK